MEWAWFIVAIVAITSMAEVVKKWLSLKEKETKKDPQQAARLKELEERVEVLERIATDDRSRLKQTIDAL